LHNKSYSQFKIEALTNHTFFSALTWENERIFSARQYAIARYIVSPVRLSVNNKAVLL